MVGPRQVVYEIVVESWQMLNCRGVFWMSDAVGYWTSIFYKKGMEDFVNDAALLRWSLKECELQCYWSQWEHREIQWKPTLRSAEAQSRVVETHIVRVSTRHPERAGAKDMYWPRCCLFALYGIWVCLLCDASTVRCRCFCFVWFHIGIQYEIKWECRSWKNWKFVHCSMLSESSLSRDIWLISIGCLPHFLLYVQFWRYILCWYQPILLPQPLLSRKDPLP